jgi:hypothetical protein
VTHRLLCCFYGVDYTFVISLHGTEKLERFLDHVNGLHRNILCTMEMEKDHFPSFLHIDIYRRPDGSLGHKVYRKPTHTTSNGSLDHITILPTYKMFFQP